VLLRHFRQAQTGEAVSPNSSPVNDKRCAPYLAPLPTELSAFPR
jgi:hypothetical protein